MGPCFASQGFHSNAHFCPLGDLQKVRVNDAPLRAGEKAKNAIPAVYPSELPRGVGCRPHTDVYLASCARKYEEADTPQQKALAREETGFGSNWYGWGSFVPFGHFFFFLIPSIFLIATYYNKIHDGYMVYKGLLRRPAPFARSGQRNV